MAIRDWFVRKLVSGQVRAVSGEVKIYLSDADAVERATVLILAQLYRHNGFELEPRIFSAIDDPMSVSRTDAGSVFAILRDGLFQSQAEIKATRANFAQLGVRIPDWQERQFRRSRMALQVWMATVGVRLVEMTLPTARAIWTMLHGSLSSVSDALSQLKEFERRVGSEVTPMEPVFSSLDERETRSFCEYVPQLGVASS